MTSMPLAAAAAIPCCTVLHEWREKQSNECAGQQRRRTQASVRSAQVLAPPGLRCNLLKDVYIVNVHLMMPKADRRSVATDAKPVWLQRNGNGRRSVRGL